MRRVLALTFALALTLSVGASSALAVPVLLPATLYAQLNGPNEVPGPGDADGQGVAMIRVTPSTNQVCWILAVRNIQQAGAAHIHSGGPTVAGPVEVGLTPPNQYGLSFGCATAAADDVTGLVLNPGQYYVNVHNATFPAGAIRGQLFRTDTLTGA